MRAPVPAAPVLAGICSRDSAASSSASAAGQYEAALAASRKQEYPVARATYIQLTTQHPQFDKAWISWAQMEKRQARLGDPGGWARARSVLDAGLRANGAAHPAILQAWGLTELQLGNDWVAVRMLDRAAGLDPGRCGPVLQWAQVRRAREAAEATRSARRQQRAAAAQA